MYTHLYEVYMHIYLCTYIQYMHSSTSIHVCICESLPLYVYTPMCTTVQLALQVPSLVHPSVNTHFTQSLAHVRYQIVLISGNSNEKCRLSVPLRCLLTKLDYIYFMYLVCAYECT